MLTPSMSARLAISSCNDTGIRTDIVPDKPRGGSGFDFYTRVLKTLFRVTHYEVRRTEPEPDFEGMEMAGWTGLEPAASGVTGRRYNQLNYHPAVESRASLKKEGRSVKGSDGEKRSKFVDGSSERTPVGRKFPHESALLNCR